MLVCAIGEVFTGLVILIQIAAEAVGLLAIEGVVGDVVQCILCLSLVSLVQNHRSLDGFTCGSSLAISLEEVCQCGQLCHLVQCVGIYIEQ